LNLRVVSMKLVVLALALGAACAFTPTVGYSIGVNVL